MDHVARSASMSNGAADDEADARAAAGPADARDEEGTGAEAEPTDGGPEGAAAGAASPEFEAAPRHRVLNWLRASIVLLLGLVAAVCVPLSVAAWWTVNTIASASRYEATLDPLARQQALLQYVEHRTAKALYSALPQDESSLPRNPFMQAGMTRAVTAAYRSPQFRLLWNFEVAGSHPVAESVLLNRPSSARYARQGVVIDLTPMINRVVLDLDLQGLHQFDQARADLVGTDPLRFKVLTAGQVKEVRHVFTWLDDLHVALPIVAAVALAGALVLGRHRILVLASTATGAAVATGICLAGLAGTSALAVHRALQLQADKTVSNQFCDTLFHYLWRDLYVCLGVSLFVAAAGWILDWRLAVRRRHLVPDLGAVVLPGPEPGAPPGPEPGTQMGADERAELEAAARGKHVARSSILTGRGDAAAESPPLLPGDDTPPHGQPAVSTAGLDEAGEPAAGDSPGSANAGEPEQDDEQADDPAGAEDGEEASGRADDRTADEQADDRTADEQADEQVDDRTADEQARRGAGGQR